ncbi:MAG TPA: cytochrome c [Gemmatimonadales bacterium]
MKRNLVVFVTGVLAAGCTADQWQRFPSPDDAIALVPWFSTMHTGIAVQPYQWPNPRPPVEGTIPVGGNEPPTLVVPANQRIIDALANPVERTAASIERGQDRYDIYCLPCHGVQGAGDGPVNVKLLVTPSLLTDRATNFTDGYLYAILRHGRGIMPAYGDRIRGEDRWHVVNYVRTLQGGTP